MQWIVDIVRFKLAAYLQGKIFLWSGSIVDIPDGWQLCNGGQGTPDLRDNFIVGSGSSYNPNDEGGGNVHGHDMTISGLPHTIPSGNDLASGVGYDNKTNTHFLSGQTFLGTTLAPFYSLAYIMKL